MPAGAPHVVHGTCVAFGAGGVLILGASGRGKSALALQLMAIGAELVADDQVALTVQAGALLAAAPPGLPALIEARGVGLLRAPLRAGVALALVVDLDQTETDRLPPWRHTTLCDVPLPLVLGPVSGHLPAAIRHYVQWGRGD